MALHEIQTAEETVRIWVIAPTEDFQARLAVALEELPYDVAYASAGAVPKWSADECNIVLLAADVSEEQREQFFARRRATDSRTTRTTPVIVVAAREPNADSNGRDVEQAVEQLLQLGADDFIWLPATSTMLRARIENMLALCRLRRREEDYFKDDTTLKLEHDLQVARRIQAGFLPRTLPQAPGWEVSARFQPAREVAGDFYDAFMMSQNRRIGFVIADVVDKGIPAALFMALVRSLTRAFAQQNYSVNWSDLLGGDSPAPGPRAQKAPRPEGTRQRRTIPSTGTISLYNAVLLTNNYIIDNHIEDNMFATLFFGMVDPSTGQLAYINAGHNPPYILDAQGNVKATLTNTGAAVGMFPNMDYKIEQAQMEPGDLLFAYTDGVTEARNVAGEFVTDQGLLDLLAQPLDEGPHAATKLLDRVDLYLQEFMQDAVPFDDITMIAIHYRKDEI